MKLECSHQMIERLPSNSVQCAVCREILGKVSNATWNSIDFDRIIEEARKERKERIKNSEFKELYIGAE